MALPAGQTMSRASRAHTSAQLLLPVPILGLARWAGRRGGNGARCSSLGAWAYVVEYLGPASRRALPAPHAATCVCSWGGARAGKRPGGGRACSSVPPDGGRPPPPAASDGWEGEGRATGLGCSGAGPLGLWEGSHRPARRPLLLEPGPQRSELEGWRPQPASAQGPRGVTRHSELNLLLQGHRLSWPHGSYSARECPLVLRT